MDDDFNTAAGLAVLFKLAKSLKREFNLRYYQSEKEFSDMQLHASLQFLIRLAQVFGLEASCKASQAPEVNSDWIEALLHQRQQARQEKRYAESDRICSELQTAGIILVDQPDGQTCWHRS